MSTGIVIDSWGRVLDHNRDGFYDIVKLQASNASPDGVQATIYSGKDGSELAKYNGNQNGASMPEFWSHVTFIQKDGSHTHDSFPERVGFVKDESGKYQLVAAVFKSTTDGTKIITSTGYKDAGKDPMNANATSTLNLVGDSRLEKTTEGTCNIHYPGDSPYVQEMVPAIYVSILPDVKK
jgi:hypothetical protein